VGDLNCFRALLCLLTPYLGDATGFLLIITMSRLILKLLKHGVAVTGRNTTGPQCSVTLEL